MEKSLDLGINNKHSIGKHLRSKIGLYKPDLNAKIIEKSQKTKEYFDYYLNNGAKIYSLETANFYFKNGLPYGGMVATEKIRPGQSILQIPRKFVLTTTDAYFSDLKEIFDKSPEYFIPANTWAWEYRLIIIYLLDEYSKGKESKWYQLINSMPRDCDCVSYWSDEEINRFEDEDFIKEVKEAKAEYAKEVAPIVEFVQKYPDVLDPSVFTEENIKWIWAQIATRSFGWTGNTKYTSLIPLAEFFNHSFTHLQYDVVFSKNELADPESRKEITEEYLNELTTTEGSDIQQDPNLEEDFIRQSDETTDSSINLNDVEQKANLLLTSLSQKLTSFNAFEISFLNYFSNDVQELVKEAHSNEISSDQAIKSLESLQIISTKYLVDLQKFKDEVLPKKTVDPFFDESVLPNQKKEAKKQTEHPFKDLTAEDVLGKEFDTFEVKLSDLDQFEKGAQVMIPYGPLTNRYLLLEYGFAMENNKADYYFLKLPLQVEQNEWTTKYLQTINETKNVTFKLGWTHVNISFINFLKSSIFEPKKYSYNAFIQPTDIKLEAQAISKAIEVVKKHLNSFSKSPEEHDALLHDKNTGYHEYFIITYKLERQNILRLHLQNLEILSEIIKRLESGEGLKEACRRVDQLETQDETPRNRFFLRKYLYQLNFTLCS